MGRGKGKDGVESQPTAAMLTKNTIRSLAVRASSTRLSWVSTCRAILDAIGYDIDAACTAFEDAVRGAAFNFLLRNARRMPSEQDGERKLATPNEAEREQLTRWFLIVLGREICAEACVRARAAASDATVAAIDMKLRTRLAHPSLLLEGAWVEGPDLLLHRIAAQSLAIERGEQVCENRASRDASKKSLDAFRAET